MSSREGEERALASPPIAGQRGSGVVRAGLLSMVGLVALGTTRLVHGSLVSRATDESTFALVGTLIGLAMTAGLFLPGGLASAASRFIPYHRGSGDLDQARAAYRVLTIAGYACAIASGALVGGIATALPGASAGDALAAAALTAVYSAYSVAKGALYGFDRVVPYTWLEIAGSVVAVGATVLVVATGNRAYLTPLTVGYAVLLVGSFLVLRRAHTGGVAGGVRLAHRELASYVGLASIGGVASAGLLQVLPALASQLTTDVEVAYLVAAVTLVAPLYFLPRALSMALFPAMAKAHGAGDTAVVRAQADVFTRALLVVLAPLFGAAMLVAPEVLALFGNARYAEGASVLRVVLLATYLAVAQVAAVNTLSSGDSVRIPVYSTVVGAVVGLVALVPLGWWFGATGVGVGYLVAVAVGAAVPIAVVWRRFAMSWTGAVVRSLAVVLVAMVAGQVTEVRPYGGVRVVVDVLAGVGVAAAGGVLLRRDIESVLTARRTAG